MRAACSGTRVACSGVKATCSGVRAALLRRCGGVWALCAAKKGGGTVSSGVQRRVGGREGGKYDEQRREGGFAAELRRCASGVRAA